MSKSANPFLIPALGGTALVLGLSYGLMTRGYKADEAEAAAARATAAEARAEAAAGEAADLAARIETVEAEGAELAARITAIEAEGAEKLAALELQLQQANAAAGPVPAGDPMPDSVTLDLGRVATAEEVAAWNIDVRPDGQGLPVGSGDVLTGEELYLDLCSTCHGVFGEAEGRWPVLAGGHGSLTNDRPVKTIGSYWPYASTIFDYVHRAMPFGQAQSLTDDEVYAIVAQLLYLNDLVDEDFVLSNENFAEVTLPNEGSFFPDDRLAEEHALFTGEACMSDCKDSVEITARAAVIDVTPDDAAARQRREEAAAGAGTTPETPVETAPEAEQPGDTELAGGEISGNGNTVVAAAADPALIEAGETVFRKCKTCHQVGDGAKNRTGPLLNDLFDRAAGSVDGFRYSGALEEMAEGGLIWTDATLAAFLEDPRGYVSGTKMSFSGLRKAEDIDAVIAYLRTFDE